MHLEQSVRHIPWTELYVRSTSVLCKNILYYKLSEDKKLLRPENGYKETFLWKRNGQKWCFLLFLCSFGPKKHRKTPVFLSPLKNDPQQKWSVFKSEIVTANIFIGYQYLANQQQKTAWKSSYSTFLVGIPEVWKKS